MAPHTRVFARALTAVALFAAVCFAAPARAQEAAPAEGIVQGRVIDAATGAPLEGVTVTVLGGGDAAPVRVTDRDGAFEFESLPAGSYAIRFEKVGYRASTTADVAVRAHQMSRADFALPPEAAPAAADGAGPPPDIEEVVVLAPAAGEILAASRMDADELINTLDASEFAKFAASDVADALKFVPGVNVVEGQFAIIRGLEDRYSSTLYNFAPVPSPDPDSQSVQLDLFPADVVTNLVVAKTFAPELPSNSSGGAINIITQDYPEELELKISAGGGWNDNAADRFLQFNDGSPVGSETSFGDVLENEFGGSVGGRRDVLGRELRFKAVLHRELDFETATGTQEGREPARSATRLFPRPARTVRSGDLALGELSLSDGRFDLTESERSEQNAGYLGFGLDLDEDGDHRIDGSLFYTKKEEETVQLKENGFFPTFDYERLRAKQLAGQEIDRNADFTGFATPTAWIARSVRGTPNEPPSRGPLWYASFAESESFQRDRDLFVLQLNGDHTIEPVEGLHLSWAGNQARTTQEENAAGARMFYEPDDPGTIPTQFPVTAQALGPGAWVANSGIFASSNEITENQDFARFDADYELPVVDALTLTFNAGLWYERSKRSVDASFLESPSVEGSSQFAITGDTQEELGDAIFDELDRTGGTLSGLRETTTEASREIEAWDVGAKATLWERIDLLAGIRRENLFIESLNDPFTGETRFGAPAIFPEAYLFFDRLDNPARAEVARIPGPGTQFNDELLGVDVPVDPATGLVDLTTREQIDALVNGVIDEELLLPSFGVNVRPIDGLSVRGAYSRTVARPSFREMGFYVSVEPGTDDLIVGNPQLVLSNVASWDARVEYTWGDRGDLVAASVFKKKIENPIESIVVRNPLNAEGSSSALYRTFFNNPDTASLRGVELEARKSFDFLGDWIGVDALGYLSIGGNFTYIDAEVDRTEAELARSRAFFGTAPLDTPRFTRLAPSRRLFNQPEWIANADLTFDHPDWGTKATLSFFAISNVLDAAGSASLNNNNDVISFTLDRYVDSYVQLDFVVSQTWHVERLRGDLTLKLSAKNLTDSLRSVVYDPEQTRRETSERSFRVGRDYSLSLTYTF